MVDKEMLERKKLSLIMDDLARDIYELVTKCNGMKKDLTIYL
jgi:hypothetical protein